MHTTNGIKSWPEDDRPREKMARKGPAALSDTELIAILIASGTKEKSAIDVARDVMALVNNNINELGRLNLKQLQKTKGIGEAKAISIAAALELGRRRQSSKAQKRNVVTCSKDLAQIVLPHLQDLNHEIFCVVYLNQSNKILKIEILSSGGVSSTIVDIRLLLKNALLNNATKIAVAHNHPSGNLTPSKDDIKLTQNIKEAAKIMDITLIDHIIVAHNRYKSFADEGLL